MEVRCCTASCTRCLQLHACRLTMCSQRLAEAILIGVSCFGMAAASFGHGWSLQAGRLAC